MEVVLPIFRAMVEGAEAAVLDMHSQQWDAAQPPGDDGRGAVAASRYMDVLTRRLTHNRHACSHMDARLAATDFRTWPARRAQMPPAGMERGQAPNMPS